jgi:predicted RND superfamily exporter protein
VNNKFTDFAIFNPKKMFIIMFLLVAGLGSMMPNIQINTDPEAMLEEDNPKRVMHNIIKQKFNLYDLVIVGMVNEETSQGIYNKKSLNTLFELNSKISQIDGVIQQDIMSLPVSDNIFQQGEGVIRFEWMMNSKPQDSKAIEKIMNAVDRLPLLKNTMVSDDNKVAMIYIPIVSKDQSFIIASTIEKLISEVSIKNSSNDSFHITGLPVAEDTFGKDMFDQMAIAVPITSALIVLIMWIFFRNFNLVSAPMLMAHGVVIATMGLLVGLGYTVHIMSSLIPIFLIPIAIVDSVHILSEFSDSFKRGDNARERIRKTIAELYKPMLFTSLTSAAGFASLYFTPIPPVQSFGLFVAFGIILAFLLSVTFIPAYIVNLPEEKLLKMVENRRRKADEDNSLLGRFLISQNRFSLKYSKSISLAIVAVVAISGYGITKIVIDDDPIYWFGEDHKIRTAARVLNQHMAGTYNAFLVLNKTDTSEEESHYWKQAQQVLDSENPQFNIIWQRIKDTAIVKSKSFPEIVENIIAQIDNQIFEGNATEINSWERMIALSELAYQSSKVFTQPEHLNYLNNLEKSLLNSDLIGKVNGLPALVKTVHRELNEGLDKEYRIPDSQNGIAQVILSFQGSHRPDDLWHFVTQDYRSVSLWLQMNKGSHQDMLTVLDFVDSYIDNNPLPRGVELEWGGLTYLNVIWQDTMVNGMLNSLYTAAIVVFLMMVLLFRSVVFGIIAMIPLSVTVLLIYGFIGLIGKNYDAPIAILSSLVLGLSIDFSIHFLVRARSLYQEIGNWSHVMKVMAKEPARAISRNAIIIAIGFAPLVLSPLPPYKTVGSFLAAIMVISSFITLILLPIILTKISSKKLRLRNTGASDNTRGVNAS